MRNVDRCKSRDVEAFEMWCYRRMEKIGGTDRVTDEEVAERVGDREKSDMEDYKTQRNENLYAVVLRHDVGWL